jgi:hypothetical protein
MSAAFDSIVRGGSMITGEEVRIADIGIRDGRSNRSAPRRVALQRR